jgi:hypothetical protein
MDGYLKAGQKGDWESESRRPEIFSRHDDGIRAAIGCA